MQWCISFLAILTPSNQFEKRERVENTTRSGVFLTSGDETLSRMLHITSQTNDFRKRN